METDFIAIFLVMVIRPCRATRTSTIAELVVASHDHTSLKMDSKRIVRTRKKKPHLKETNRFAEIDDRSRGKKRMNRFVFLVSGGNVLRVVGCS